MCLVGRRDSMMCKGTLRIKTSKQQRYGVSWESIREKSGKQAASKAKGISMLFKWLGFILWEIKCWWRNLTKGVVWSKFLLRRKSLSGLNKDDLVKRVHVCFCYRCCTYVRLAALPYLLLSALLGVWCRPVTLSPHSSKPLFSVSAAAVINAVERRQMKRRAEGSATRVTAIKVSVCKKAELQKQQHNAGIWEHTMC